MIENDFFDTPSEYTSSIGAIVWPPENASYERKKGFYHEVLESNDDFDNFLKEFGEIPFGEVTRISGRVVVSIKAFEGIANNESKNFIETLIPLVGCGIPELDDCVLVYIGRNRPQRMPSNELIQEQYRLAKEIFNKENNAKDTKSISSEADGIEIVKFDPNGLTEESLQQYRQLYSPFGWQRDEIEQMLTSPNNIIVYAKKGRLIVSSVLGEKGSIKVKRNNQTVGLRVVEITEATTHPDFREKRLYQRVSNTLLYLLAQSSTQPNLVFGELNLDSPGVLKVAARQGRIPAWQTAENFGLYNAWVLPQHVKISQGNQTENEKPVNSPYNNLMVAFLPKNLLLEKYG